VSLLMDALKRAEKARQAEADRAKAEGRDSDASELSLHPLDDGAAERDAQQPGEPRPAGSDTEDSLELTPPEVRREIESMVADPELDAVTEHFAPDAARDAPRSPDDSLSLSLEYGDISLDETGSTLPSMRSAQRSVQDYFDGTHSMSMSMEDVGGAIAAERDDAPAPDHEAAADAPEGNTTSRRRAQAVLDARAVAPSNTGRNVAVVLLVLIALGLGGAGLLFKDRIVALFDARPSVVAQRPPPPRAAPAAGEQAGAAAAVDGRPAADDRGAAALAADERDALLRAAEAARAEERALAEAAAAAQAEMHARAEASAAAAAAPADPVPADPARGSSGSARTAAAAPPASAPPPVALSEVLGQDGGAAGVLPMAPSMQISRRRGPLRTHADLMQGFDAFQRGDDGSAMSAYQRILAREPRNRDALLGAAAVYMRGQAYERAAGQYMEVLRSYPRDAVAQAALISMQEDIDPVAAQSRLKMLLVASPQDPNLHFSLGNLYAGQGRWPEAQQAFFQAYRLDGENPDYAFNLAVSLDRLAQRAAAREYYARADALAATHPAAFDPAQARARLAALEPP
jgi:tetratricopeptide (TPR) repeat protein